MFFLHPKPQNIKSLPRGPVQNGVFPVFFMAALSGRELGSHTVSSATTLEDVTVWLRAHLCASERVSLALVRGLVRFSEVRVPSLSLSLSTICLSPSLSLFCLFLEKHLSQAASLPFLEASDGDEYLVHQAGLSIKASLPSPLFSSLQSH
jgi:hypothetical protein